MTSPALSSDDGARQDVSAAGIIRHDIAVAVVERDGLVLIGLRGEGGPLAGFWEFPGGKVHEGESPEDAARRECWEETGVAIRVTGSYPVAEHDYPHGALRIHFLAAEPIGAAARLPERFRWVKREDLRDYRFPPATAEMLSELSRRAAPN